MQTTWFRACGVALLTLWGGLVTSHAAAQDHVHPSDVPAQSTPRSERPIVRAVRLDKAPKIDGALDEPAWATVPKIDGFTQQEPRIGEAASERTEVGVAYDSRHL